MPQIMFVNIKTVCKVQVLFVCMKCSGKIINALKLAVKVYTRDVKVQQQ